MNDVRRTDVLGDLGRRGLVAQSTDPEALAVELAAGPVTLYCGFDPTAPSLHVGNLLQILTLRRFQDAGHRPLALVGGATGLIGDPRPTAERVLHSPETVREWVERIRAQLQPLLRFDGTNGAVIVDNLDWLGRVSAIELLRDVGKHFRVGRMLAKEAVSARLASQHGISYTEFSYQILQATDYLELYRRHGCRLQTGGSDQWGNLTAGVDLVHRVEGASVHALTTPLLTKADGTKFGKTEAGTVWLDADMTSPYAFYQFWLATDDRDVVRLLRLFTFATEEELAALESETADAPQRRSAHRRLAADVTELVHGRAALEAVRDASAALFGGGTLAALDPRTLVDAARELPRHPVPWGTPVVEALVGTGLAPSRAAARRSVGEGAVHVNNVKVTDTDETLEAEHFLHGEVAILRRGRRALSAAVRPGGAADGGTAA
ncbi:MAG: tyrosine--tRNA ligase [Kineosporiaceae bacterium]